MPTTDTRPKRAMSPRIARPPSPRPSPHPPTGARRPPVRGAVVQGADASGRARQESPAQLALEHAVDRAERARTDRRSVIRVTLLVEVVRLGGERVRQLPARKGVDPPLA